MIARVVVSAHISHPHIKAMVCQDVGKTLVLEVSQPVSTGAEEPMLQEEHWSVRHCNDEMQKSGQY